MILCECTCQAPETLEEHFSSLNRKHINGRGTLALIEALRAYPDDRKVYCLSSVDRLCFLSQDDYTSPWWVVLTSHGPTDFRIDCRMPEAQAPWRGAKILGKTKKLDRALEIVTRAMIVSRGWNSELGGVPIGLDEIVEQSLGLFRFKDAEEECRKLMNGWSNLTRACPVSGEEVTLTTLAETGEGEALAYRHDGHFTTKRWGLIDPDSEELCPDLVWQYWMDDAFCRSQAWDGPPPPEA